MAHFRRFEYVHPCPVLVGNPRDCRLARDLPGAVVNQRIPERRPTDCEADESRDGGCGPEPVPHLIVVLAAAQNNAADSLSAAAPGGGDDLIAIIFVFDPFDLPNV